MAALDATVVLRMSEADKRDLAEMADRDGRTVSGYIRRLVAEYRVTAGQLTTRAA